MPEPHLPRLLRGVPFWLVGGMLAFCALAEYSEQLGVPNHADDRLPV